MIFQFFNWPKNADPAEKLAYLAKNSNVEKGVFCLITIQYQFICIDFIEHSKGF